MIIKHECKKCKMSFNLVNGQTLKEETSLCVRKSGNETLYLTVTVCPFCGYKEVVQVDNDETIELFRLLVRKIKSRKAKLINSQLDSKRKDLFERFKQLQLRSKFSC